MSGSLWNPGGPSNPLAQLGQGVTQPINLLATAAQAQQFQQNQLALRSAQQQLTARQAVGQAYQAAANPDGSVDYGKLQANIEGNPDASWMAPQILQGIQEQQARAFGLQKQGQDQSTSRAGIFSSALAPLLAKGDDVGTPDVTGVLARLHAAGIPVDGAVQQVIQTMPTGGGAPLPAADQASVFLPKVGTQDTGGQVQTYDQNPVTSPNATSLTFNKTLSPDSQVRQVTGPLNARGGATVLPQAAYATGVGMGGLVPGASSVFGTGRSSGLPSALLNPNAASGSGATTPAPTAPQPPTTALGQPMSGTGAPMTTGLGPGQQAGLETAGKSSADQWGALQAQVGGTAAGGGMGGRIYQLQSAQRDLAALGPNGSGASSQTWNSIKSYFNTIPGVSSVIGFDPNTIADYDMAHKAMINYATARAGAHGGTTDSQLATTLSGNASTSISNLAASQVTSANIGLERMDQAQAKAFQSAKDPTTGQPLTPDQFSSFSANWNSTMDPRAFVADQLQPAQVKDLVSSMSPSDQAKFQNTYTTAINNGWMTPPAWAQPAAGAGTATAPAAAPAAAPSIADMAINPGGAVAPATGMTPNGN